jgi:hypothetical protein
VATELEKASLLHHTKAAILHQRLAKAHKAIGERHNRDDQVLGQHHQTVSDLHAKFSKAHLSMCKMFGAEQERVEDLPEPEELEERGQAGGEVERLRRLSKCLSQPM